MRILNVIKKLFRKDRKKITAGGDSEDSANKSPEETELQQRIDKTIHCYVCGRASGFYRITLRKVSKGKYICQFCKPETPDYLGVKKNREFMKRAKKVF